MECIEFTPELCCDLFQIDEQHRKLIDLFNELVLSKASSAERGTRLGLVARFRQFFAEHLESELRLHGKRKLPKGHRKCAQADESLRQIDRLCLQMSMPNAKFDEAVLTAFRQCLLEHIRPVDQPTASGEPSLSKSL